MMLKIHVRNIKKTLLLFIIISTPFLYAQDIEVEFIIDNSEAERQITTPNNTYTNTVYTKIVYDKTIDDLFFINAYDGSLSAYDVNNNKKWRFIPKDSIALKNEGNKFYYKDGVIFTAYRSGYIYALNAKDGRIFWQGKIGMDKGKLKLKNQSLKPFNNKLYLNSHNGHVYVLNASNGDKIWSHGLVYDSSAPVPNLVNDNNLYTINANYIYNFECESGKVIHKKHFKNIMHGKPLYFDKNIIIANRLKTLFSISSENLDINWEFVLNKNEYKIGEKLLIENESIYIGTFSFTDTTSIYKINAKTGLEVWSTKIPEHRIKYITLYNDTIYGYTSKGTLFLIDKHTGDIKKTITPKNKPISNLEYTDTSLYYYAKAGLIVYNLTSMKEDILIPYTGDTSKWAGESQILTPYN